MAVFLRPETLAVTGPVTAINRLATINIITRLRTMSVLSSSLVREADSYCRKALRSAYTQSIDVANR